MYEIAISDLDGTLLGSDHKVSPVTKKSIEQWIASGREFVIATGRNYIEAKYVQESIDMPIYIISSNGGRVHNAKGEIVFKKDLPSDIAQYICQYEYPQQVQVSLFTDQHWHTNFVHPDQAGIDTGAGFDPIVTDLKSFDVNNVIKMLFWSDPEDLLIISEQLKAKFGDRINLTFSLAKCLEVMPGGVDKGVAANAVLKALNIKKESAVAFGDGMNDVELLKSVGKPMLMKNSQPALISTLPDAQMTNSSDENGVASVLDQLRK